MTSKLLDTGEADIELQSLTREGSPIIWMNAVVEKTARPSDARPSRWALGTKTP